uniref:Uncharacterized protein LOC104245586 n=1 Tax=Nicotiana sylvestris TaxID=4096 RepID=A0A1U7YJV4_NICSY|nr:PREDICTED: uncharacterized protein LOC104245586 [Nicotiana sylvestris]
MKLVSMLQKGGFRNKRSTMWSRCMPRNASRTGEVFEALSDPEKVFKPLNRANQKSKQQQVTEQIEPDMGDNVVDPAVPIAPVAPLVTGAALYDWAQPTTKNPATAIVVS